MQKTLCFLFLLCIFQLSSRQLSAQVDDAPVLGVSDKRAEVYGLKNARVYTDYQTTLENTDILISNGRIEAIGKNLVFPKGAIIYDLTGKTVYPSFVDVYAGNYGIKMQQSAQDANPYAAFMTQAVRGGQPSTPEPRIADYWNDGINASYDVSTEFIPDSKTAGEYRQAGFGAVVTFKVDGIARGTSALVSTGEGKSNNMIIKNKTSANYSITRGRSADLYPASQFGIIALLRQVNYDAQWYKQLPAGYFHDDGLEAYTAGLALPQIFEVTNKLEILRADRIGKEFGINFIVKGGGDEYQALNDIKKAGNKLIIPVNFPEAPDVKDPYDAMNVSYTTLKHYELAPTNLSRVSSAGITFAITSSDLKQRSSFITNLRKAIKYGLPETEALKALTATPAAMVGASDLVGGVKKNMLANLLVTSGNIFEDDCVIYENWVQGIPYRLVDYRIRDLRGTWTLKVDTSEYKMVLSGAFDKPSLKLMSDTTQVRGATFTREKDLVSIVFDKARQKYRLSGYISGNNLEGNGQLDNGKWFSWQATFTDSKTGPEKPKRPTPVPELGKVVYPFSAYGWEELPKQEDVLFRNATVWTSEKEGKLLNTDVLVKSGKIARIGKNLNAPSGTRLIDATGMHLTPGIIDEHSHIASDATNEMGQAITSEVRIGDVIDPEDITIYRQLAGGVTLSHILHGSANPIGGQSTLIKERWGHNAEELKVENQVMFLKHALGENVKRNTSRYPNTRMGTEQIIRDAYQRAVDYNRKWKEWNALKTEEKAGKLPPRRDLELDAIVDVLEKRSFIECHTYVQSEGAMILNLANEFGVKVNSLIHFNEGYKIADQIKEHGAAASVFSDWWNYKYEVYEGTSYNASMLVKQGVLTCLHSDDAEMGRRLNQEAGKMLKYGGLSETEALKLITINPAIMLHLGDRTGSIKEGKDADLVLWTDNPLSMYARASKTMVDGTIYFDEETDAKMKEKIDGERNRIISAILKEAAPSASANTTNSPRR
ncbi:MAG TPA: amidohydrolase family protein [Bacteroidales bacterium]|nr:amidohydrolase family protein [Bacteroidales bacterium]